MLSIRTRREYFSSDDKETNLYFLESLIASFPPKSFKEIKTWTKQLCTTFSLRETERERERERVLKARHNCIIHFHKSNNQRITIFHSSISKLNALSAQISIPFKIGRALERDHHLAKISLCRRGRGVVAQLENNSVSRGAVTPASVTDTGVNSSRFEFALNRPTTPACHPANLLHRVTCQFARDKVARGKERGSLWTRG